MNFQCLHNKSGINKAANIARTTADMIPNILLSKPLKPSFEGRPSLSPCDSTLDKLAIDPV